MIRRHRLVELFLTRVLGLDWSEVDAEAEALEHAISPRLEAAIATHLGEPLEDPHGHPIPSSTGELRQRDLKRLSEFRAGEVIVIREVADDNSERFGAGVCRGSRQVPKSTFSVIRNLTTSLKSACLEL